MPQKTNSDLSEGRLAKRRQAYKDMPRDKYVSIRAKENAASALRRKMETPEQRAARLAPMRERARRRLASETPEQRQARLADQKRRKPAYRSANIERLKGKERSYYEKNRARIIANERRTEKQTLKCRRFDQKPSGPPIHAMQWQAGFDVGCEAH
jgi:hypothetical protein